MRSSLLILAASTLFWVSHGVAFAEEPAARTPTVLPADAAEASHVTDVAQLIHNCLVLLYEKTSDKDTQFYENGLWHFTNEKGSEGREAGPARAAATLWRWQAFALKHGVLPAALKDQATPEKQEWLHRIAIETVDRLIKDFQNPDGSFQDPKVPATYFFAVELASIYLQLKDSLDASTRQRWLDTLRQEVDFMVAHGDLPNLEKGTPGWYTNGNIELGEAELLYKTWLATGDAKYQRLYDVQWNHTLAPSQTRWKGFGLAYKQEPTKPDGSDGCGYLAESGGGAPGYDPSYTGVQLGVAASLYSESRDPKVLRLFNLLINSCVERVDQTLWTYDASNGTRKNYKGMFTTSALTIAAYQGGRSDLKPLVALQFNKSIKPQYMGMAIQNWNSPNFYLGMGTELAVMLEPYIPDGEVK